MKMKTLNAMRLRTVLFGLAASTAAVLSPGGP